MLIYEARRCVVSSLRLSMHAKMLERNADVTVVQIALGIGLALHGIDGSLPYLGI